MSGETPFFPPDIAVHIVNKCEQAQIPIYGIDAAKIADTCIQPYMQHSVDYTTSPYPEGYFENVWDEAIQFIKRREQLGLHFEIVIPTEYRADTVLSTQNKSNL